MTDLLDLQKKIKAVEQSAFALGFSGFGITRPGVDEAARRLQTWLNQNYEGEMTYMGRWTEKRSDLNKVLPGAQSVICLRMNYFTAPKNMGFLDRPDFGDISLYALNEDYHGVMSSKLKDLEKRLKIEFPAIQTKAYVDTGPILEKPLAQQAGLGWIGKHTNLISEGIGSWYFLAEILIDIWLPEYEPEENRCGTCRECIDICPTRAIVAPYVLDARRCISYLTIELKGVIPLEFRKAIGNRIYGCDDCQIVCPWNSFATPVQEPAFRGQVTALRLIDLIRLDEDGFNRLFHKSPIKRLKRRGFLRNVAVALGNSGNAGAVKPLIEALQDKEPLIRAHVVWALGELLLEKSLPVVQQYLETDATVLEEVRHLKLRFNSV